LPPNAGSYAYAATSIRTAGAMTSSSAKSFPRASRLLRHADFERVYKQGRRHFSASMTVFYCPRIAAEVKPRSAAPESHGLRVGFTVSRALGGAVQRNRMKRRLREAVRMSLPESGVAADVVINPKKSLLSAEFATVRSEIERAFAVIQQKLSQQKLTEQAAPAEAAKKKEKCREPNAGS
jgi:ribonuclease P protein component